MDTLELVRGNRAKLVAVPIRSQATDDARSTKEVVMNPIVVVSHLNEINNNALQPIRLYVG